MEAMVNAIAAQANELMKNPHIVAMLEGCGNDIERREKLALAAVYALIKANK